MCDFVIDEVLELCGVAFANNVSCHELSPAWAPAESRRVD